jgi:hypothetical protein
MAYLWAPLLVIDILSKGALHEKYTDHGHANVEVGILPTNITERWGIYNRREIVVTDSEENTRRSRLLLYLGSNPEMPVTFV